MDGRKNWHVARGARLVIMQGFGASYISNCSWQYYLQNFRYLLCLLY